MFGDAIRETWLSTRDSGLVTAVRRSLEPLLKNTTVTADDILQPAIVGLGASGAGPDREYSGSIRTGSILWCGGSASTGVFGPGVFCGAAGALRRRLVER